jgi:spoIIIJ-associated protein
MEFESKNVEKALQKASEELNIPADKLEHEVISHGSTGIFGLVGAKKAKIRVVLSDSATEKDDSGTDEKPQSTKENVASILDETFGKEDTADDVEDAASFGMDVVKRLIDFITTDAEVDVVKNGDKIQYNVSGGNTALLIGKRGQTLEAMQYLVEKIVNKQHERHIRIQIDIEGYLNSRRERLESLTLRLGEKVKRTGKPLTVGQFNAHDRRIIHMILKEEDALRTQSMGEGYLRKIKIFPKRKRKKNKQNRKMPSKDGS